MQSSRFLRVKRHHWEIEDDGDCSDMPIAKRITRLNIKSQRNSVDDPSSLYQSEVGICNSTEAQQSSVSVHGMEHLVNGMGQISPTSPPAGSIYPTFPHSSETTSVYHNVWSMATAQNSIPHPSHFPCLSPPTSPMDNPSFSCHVSQITGLHSVHHQQFSENQHMLQATTDFSQDDDENMKMDFDYQPELGKEKTLTITTSTICYSMLTVIVGGEEVSR